MEKVKILVIGAGAVGLAIAYELSKYLTDVVVVDKEDSFGRHTSSRNSEVIHAGHYYKTGSLKANLCVEGNKILYQYLNENQIPYNNTGKIIVATSKSEEIILRRYLDQSLKNGCYGFRLLSKDEVAELEPQVKCISGLFAPSTGIFDTHKYMQSLEANIEKLSSYIVYGYEVTCISKENNQYLVEFSNGEVFQCEYVINSAGLWADELAGILGIDTCALGIKQFWCKGEYYKSTKVKDVKHLVYPVTGSQTISLGIHMTVNMNGEVRFGPNAFYVDSLDYKFDDNYFEEFYISINKYFNISREELIPDDCGIRPKIQGPNEGFKDFYIREETLNGFTKFINLIGIESPGLTASLAIGKYVARMVDNK